MFDLIIFDCDGTLVDSMPLHHIAWCEALKAHGASFEFTEEFFYSHAGVKEQDVVRISHSDSIEDLVRLGRDVEKMVLARGLRYHLQDRVLVHDNKTVVFA